MIPTRKLKNGIEIPMLGYGTAQDWNFKLDPDAVVASTIDALRCGYTHIDTAQMYYNEHLIGQALKESGVDRRSVFLTTKLDSRCGTYDETIESIRVSMEKLGTDYLDLFLIHWPNPAAQRHRWQERNAQCWRAMEDLVSDGKIRAIGVSNFRPHHFDALMQTARIEPVVNQIRLFPGDSSLHLPTLEYCAQHSIQLEGYSPLGLGNVLSQPVLKELGEKYDRSPAQLCLRWSLQKGYIPLPKSLTPERICQNLNVFDFELDADDMARLDSIPPMMIDDRDPDSTPW